MRISRAWGGDLLDEHPRKPICRCRGSSPPQKRRLLRPPMTAKRAPRYRVNRVRSARLRTVNARLRFHVGSRLIHSRAEPLRQRKSTFGWHPSSREWMVMWGPRHSWISGITRLRKAAHLIGMHRPLMRSPRVRHSHRVMWRQLRDRLDAMQYRRDMHGNVTEHSGDRAHREQ
jgi:hypothetical protein